MAEFGQELHLASQTLAFAEDIRRELSPRIARKRKSQLGQFMTPASVARFMATLFPPSTQETCRLLDAGAGLGALTGAFLDRWTTDPRLEFKNVEIEAYEIDPELQAHLMETLSNYAGLQNVTSKILSQDFIENGVIRSLQSKGRFTHAILNPPYKKIKSDSSHRRILRRAGIETVNLYTAFVALALDLMEPGGELVAIVPRSFCNGPYYRPFREFLLKRSALRHIHLFKSRKKAFQDDAVLQENVIIRLERNGTQGAVVISHSTDAGFSDLSVHEQDFCNIVLPDDPELFIHVPASTELDLTRNPVLQSSLNDLGIEISTGPVVDFRLSKEIVPMPEMGTVPLLYAGHFVGQDTYWPKLGIKRGNAIYRNSTTEKWLYPNGFYTVVRRFSAKEERRRIVAGIVKPSAFGTAQMLGFENHLNVFHANKSGISENLAYGLAAYLNTTAVDEHFRRFNGHTQVNATDLRRIKYPTREALLTLGQWARTQEKLAQKMIDEQFERLIR